jgi:NifB/MoaA-like Fe-S oxidoreductase
LSEELARALVKEARGWQKGFRDRLGSTFVFLADEFYLRAGLPVPGRAHYGDYPQIEDGVGMVRRFIIDSRKTLARDGERDFNLKPGSLHGTVATGELFYPILKEFVDRMNERWGTRLKVISATNGFFGEEVTVAGLLAGSDLLKARQSIEGRFLIVPEQACLKSGNVFLDDLTLEELEGQLNMPVSHGGASLKSMIARAVELESRAGSEAISSAFMV